MILKPVSAEAVFTIESERKKTRCMRERRDV